MKLVETKDGTIIEVYVKPNQPRFKISIEDDDIIIESTEEPVRGRVNVELIKELSKLFQTKVELRAGATSKQKHVLVRGKRKQEVEHLLQEP